MEDLSPGLTTSPDTGRLSTTDDRAGTRLSRLDIFPPSCRGDKPADRGGGVGSESERRVQPGWDLLPRVAMAGETIAVVEEGPHVEGVEVFPLVLEREVGADVGQVEFEPIALGRHVDPIEVAEALRVDE